MADNLTAAQRARADELERRVLAGEDDVTYCLRWAAAHRQIADAAAPAK